MACARQLQRIALSLNYSTTSHGYGSLLRSPHSTEILSRSSRQRNYSSGSDIFEVNASNFDEAVINASKEKPVVLDCFADWCGPCKKLTPLLESAVRARGGAVLLAKLDVDNPDNANIAFKFGVSAVPAVFAIRNGQVVDSFVGLLPDDRIAAFLDDVQSG